jgi:hypothetical protein
LVRLDITGSVALLSVWYGREVNRSGKNCDRSRPYAGPKHDPQCNYKRSQ